MERTTTSHTADRRSPRRRHGTTPPLAGSTIAARDDTGPFERPALWRADIISEFRLRGEERCAAASPAPGFPQVLRSVLSALGDRPAGPWIDVGGGLGGVSSWLERTLGVETIVLDLELLSLCAARRLFPTLRTVAADAAAVPLRSRSAAVAIVSGVVSLLDDLDGLLIETRRMLSRDGVLIVTDLWSTGRAKLRRDPNTFWSIEEMTAAAERHRLSRTHVAVADMTTGWWSSAAQQVNDEIDRRYVDREAYAEWRSDQDHLVAVIESDDVIAAGVVFQLESDDESDDATDDMSPPIAHRRPSDRFTQEGPPCGG